jgi:hypothetical protein
MAIPVSLSRWFGRSTIKRCRDPDTQDILFAARRSSRAPSIVPPLFPGHGNENNPGPKAEDRQRLRGKPNGCGSASFPRQWRWCRNPCQ